MQSAAILGLHELAAGTRGIVHENRRLEYRTRDEETEDKSPQTWVTHRFAVAHTLHLLAAYVVLHNAIDS